MATSSHLANTEEEEEEEAVEVSDSEDEFKVFNQALSPETSTFDLGHPFTPILDKMGIQRKPRSTLLELIESQPGGNALGKATQTRLPTPPPALPLRSEPADLKRKRGAKGQGGGGSCKNPPLSRG